MATNGSRATATYVGGINPGTWTYPATDLDNSGYTGSADDGTGRPAAYRQAWWTFIPASNGAVGLQGLSSSNPAQRIEHRLYSYDGTTLTLIEAPATGDSVGTVAVTAGTRYYLMIGAPTDTAALYGFGIYGPVPQPEPLKHLPTGMATATYMTSVNSGTWTYYPGENTFLDNSGFTSSDPDGSVRATAYRQAWWTFIPSSNGTAGIMPQSSYTGGGYPIEHRVYSFDGTTLTMLPYTGTDVATFSVTGGLRYYVMVGTTVDAPAKYLFGFFGPTASADPNATPAPAPTDTSNHQWSNATVLTPAWDGTFTTSVDNTPAVYATTEQNPTGLSFNGARAGWFTFTAIESGDGFIAGSGDSGYACGISVYAKTASGWQLVTAASGNTAPAVYPTVTAGTQYYLRVTSTSVSAGQVISLRGGLPADPTVIPPVDGTNHQWSNATVITPARDGTWSTTFDNTGSVYGSTEQNPTGIYLGGNRSGWYTFTPLASGDAGFAANSSITTCGLDVFARTASGWSIVTSNGGNAGPSVYPTVTAGVQYYLRVVSGNNTGQIIALRGALPAAPPPPDKSAAAAVISAVVRAGLPRASKPMDRLAVPAAHLTVRVRGRITGAVDNLACPPVTATVRTSGGVLDAVTAPPVTAAVIVPAASTSLNVLTLSAPFDGDTIATSTPDFTVGLDADDDTLTYTIEIQYAGTSDFTNPVTVQQDTPAVDGGVIIPAPGPVPAHGFWRARLLLDGVQELPFTGAAEFTVDATIATAVLPVSWTVSAGAARLVHLWHFDPPGPVQGDTVTAYGQGFGDTGRLLLDGAALTVQSWTLVPATDEAGSTDRTIDGDVVDPEHYEVVFTAPALNGPGGALTVEA